MLIQAPITGGQPLYVAPPTVAHSVTIGQSNWQQPPPPIQPPNWSQGVVHNPWGNVQNNPMGQKVYR